MYIFVSTKVSKLDEDRDRLRDEIQALTEKCSTLESTKNRLVEEQTRTLERADKLWKQRPINWDDVSVCERGREGGGRGEGERREKEEKYVLDG